MDVEVARQWMQANKLTINATKFTVMVISPKKTSTILNDNLPCEGCPIASKSSVRYLGVVFDNKFTFSEHVKSIQHKVACTVGGIAELKSHFPKKIL